jgi:hypothetical protein
MFVPYEVLLPYIKSNRHLLCSTWDIMGFKESAANLFNVTAKVIEYRLESLKYEIQQYLDGTPLDKIRILSLSQQNRLKINVQSINDKENDLFYKEHPDWDDSCFACQSHALNGRGFYD